MLPATRRKARRLPTSPDVSHSLFFNSISFVGFEIAQTFRVMLKRREKKSITSLTNANSCLIIWPYIRESFFFFSHNSYILVAHNTSTFTMGSSAYVLKFMFALIWLFSWFYRSARPNSKVSDGSLFTEEPIAAKGYAVHSAGDSFQVFEFKRRVPQEDDVLIRIHYCGICHSDIHQAKNEWHNSTFPMVPGHEITGVVERVGSKVKNVRVGDHAGVGCMVDSCRTCHSCTLL